MTDHTTLPHRLVLINKGAALGGMALKASLVSAQESKAAALEHLLNICLRAFNCHPNVRVVAISAAHFAFENGMVMWQCERCANFQVALEAGFRRLSWIDDGASAASGFDVQAPGPVARLAAHVRNLLASFAALFAALSAALTYDNLFRLQSRMGRCSKVAHDLFVTGGAFL